MRSKAWLAACVPLRLARMRRPAQALLGASGEARSRRLRATLAAAPVLYARAFLFDAAW